MTFCNRHLFTAQSVCPACLRWSTAWFWRAHTAYLDMAHNVSEELIAHMADESVLALWGEAVCDETPIWDYQIRPVTREPGALWVEEYDDDDSVC